MSGAIEKVIQVLEGSNFPGCYEPDAVAARAELAAKDATIERLREAVQHYAENELGRYMSELSEEAYCAGWMSGNEFYLWEVAIGQRTSYGQTTLGAEEAERLTRLSRDAGGWHTTDTFVPLDRWLEMFAARQDGHALTSLPPSDMRLVPVERLREIEFYDAPEASGREGERICIACQHFENDGHAPGCWLDAAIRDAEREKTVRPLSVGYGSLCRNLACHDSQHGLCHGPDICPLGHKEKP